MHVHLRRSASAAAIAAALAASLGFAGPASAAPARTASTTSYSNATFLQHALGLPASDTAPAIDSTTYDRFQWLLQQPGKFAVLIGDPATDATFAGHAQEVELAAKAAGVKKVYWFDPNLTGNAVVGGTTEPNIDIRNPAGITSVASTSATKYNNAWLELVGQYLGNGVTATLTGLGTEGSVVTATTGTATVNDASSPIYDYTAGTPANVSHSYFLVYDKDNQSSGQPDKVVSSIDLTATSGSAQSAVSAAIASVGAANFTAIDQFAWWKSEVNFRQVTQAPTNASGADHPTLTDADNDAASGGWRVNQVTYPELVDLLKNGNDASAVILFGGTWCPNTRPVLPGINREAQKNDVQVFNFDTVLDGGLVGGTTTSSVNPFQSRNAAAYTPTGGTTVPNSNPTFLYGDLVSQYLSNLKTQYDPNATNAANKASVTYYAGGGAGSTLSTQFKLQVPYLIGYQGNGGTAAQGGVNRQWIISNSDGTYTEYMSSWQFTNPQPGELGLSEAKLPAAAPIWSTINAQLATYTPDTDPATVIPNSGTEADDAQYLVATDSALLTFKGTGSTASVTVASSTASGSISISPTALQTALAALPTQPANLAAAKAALLDAKGQTTPDQTLVANLSTVVGAWGVAQLRKTSVTTAWGSATAPNSITGGLAAVKALTTFFDGLPNTVAPTGNGGSTDTSNGQQSQSTNTTVTPPAATPAPTPAPLVTTKVTPIKASKLVGAVAKAPTHSKAGSYKVTITVPSGHAAATGKVTLKLVKGKTAKLVTGQLKNGVVTITVPKLAKGTWKVTISWLGDANYTATKLAGASIKVKK